MKSKKIFKYLFLVSLIVALSLGGTVLAADQVDGSYLTEDDSSIGQIEIMPYGIYLQSGYSNIGKLGVGYIAAGGTTSAQTTVSTVKVSVIVEKLVGSQWLQYTSWTATKYNADYVMSSKSITVPTGYYYRTRCIHSANSDMSSSCTNGLYV